MKDELFEIFTFCSKNNIEFDLENNKEKENWVNYDPIENKVSIIVANFEDKNLKKMIEDKINEINKIFFNKKVT